MAKMSQPPTEIILTNHDKRLSIYCTGEAAEAVVAPWIDSTQSIHNGAEMVRGTGEHQAEAQIALKRYMPRSVLEPSIERLIKQITAVDGQPPKVHTIVELDDKPVNLPALVFNPTKQEITDMLIHGHAEANVPDLFVIQPLLSKN